VPIHEFGLNHNEWYSVEDLLTGAVYPWRGETNFVILSPAAAAHVLRVRRTG
jgi:hypothetical protein